ncbi:MAG TPA: hypothetical protein V6D27_00980 [Vampirovibrionales bacterium]
MKLKYLGNKSNDLERMTWDITIALLNCPEGRRIRAADNPKIREAYGLFVKNILDTAADCVKAVTQTEPKFDREAMTQYIVENHLKGKLSIRPGDI